MINWYTLDEISGHLKVSQASLYKLAQSGEIPAVKIGRNWRFDPQEVDEWLIHKHSTKKKRFPFDESLKTFYKALQEYFGERLLGLWLFGSWARNEATKESDVDLMIVLKTIDNFSKDFSDVSSLAYKSTFEKNKSIVFSCTLTDKKTFLTGIEPLLLNIRKEGIKIA